MPAEVGFNNIHGQLIFIKVQRQYSGEMTAFPTNDAGKIGYSYAKKKNTCFKELGSIFHTKYQNNWIIRPNLKQKGIKLCKMEEMGTSLVGQWLRIHLPMQGDMGSIPGWRTKIPHAEGQLSPHSTTREPTCQKLSSCKFCLRNSNLLSPVSILGMHSLPPGRPCPSSPPPPSPLLFLLHHGDPF